MGKMYIGLDLGTSSVKFAVATNQLEPLWEFKKDYSYDTPQEGWSEINPDVWIELVIEGLKEIFTQYKAENCLGIGVTGQMHTTVFIDSNLESIRSAIMWNDTRTKDLIPQLKKQLSQQVETSELARIVSTGSPLANLLWFKRYEVENYQQMTHFLMAKDYLVLKLTNSLSTDYCDASTTSMFDFINNGWSQVVQEEFSLPSKIFPPINHSAKIVGNLSLSMQQKIGISHQIPITAGTGDNVAAALASGSFESDQPLLSLGSSGVVAISNKKGDLKNTGKNVVVKINVSDQVILTQGTVQSGAQANSWWLEEILGTIDYAGEQRMIDKDKLGTNPVLFFPHLKGEKILYSDPLLRGAFIGLGLETTRAEMYQSVLEGVGFGMKTLFEAMKNNQEVLYFTIVGGGAKSKLWVEIFANILNKPMRRVAVSQEAVYGAVILAIIGVEGTFSLPETSYQLIRPEPEIAEYYQEAYKRYLKLASAMLYYRNEVEKDEKLFDLSEKTKVNKI